MKYRDAINNYSYDLIIDEIEERVASIIGEIETQEGELKDFDIEIVLKKLHKLKDNLY